MKGQSLIIQFLLFFLIGLGLFITISGFFRLQSDVFREDISGLNRNLTSSYVSSLAIAISSCKECDSVNSTFKLKNTTANYIFELKLSPDGLRVSSSPDGGSSLFNLHNLQYTFNLLGSASSYKDIRLIFNREANSIEIINTP